MAKKIKVLTDKYKSTTKVYPKVLKECLPEDVLVEANPTLAGAESELTGLQVGDTKYKIPKLYQHNITAFITGPLYLNMTIITDNNTTFTASSILQWLKNNSFIQTDNKWYGQFLLSNTTGIQSMRCSYVDDTTLGYVHIFGVITDTTLSEWTITDTVIEL